jgi:hypothetical protein
LAVCNWLLAVGQQTAATSLLCELYIFALVWGEYFFAGLIGVAPVNNGEALCSPGSPALTGLLMLGLLSVGPFEIVFVKRRTVISAVVFL